MRIGIVGSGYTAGELLRLLLVHPHVDVVAVSSTTHADQPVHSVHPHLRGLTDLVFQSQLDSSELDCVFLASGHGRAMTQVPEIVSRAGDAIRIVDLSGDFRLRDAQAYQAWYGQAHATPELLHDFVYGLPELARAHVQQARYVANPGCFATAMALSLAPLARARIQATAFVTAVTGSSGSGAIASQTTHHPTRAANLHAYRPLAHQHVPEVEQFLDELAGAPSLRLAMVPVSGPFVRGIYSICQLELPAGWNARHAHEIYHTHYSNCGFVRVLEHPPDLNTIVGSNFCDLHVTVSGVRLAVIAALDNLVKGAAGQAVQNLNVMMGWDEGSGLRMPALFP